MRYELHCCGKIYGGILDDLKKMAIGLPDDYVIYAYYESKLHEVDLRGLQWSKLTPKDIAEARRLKSKGYDTKLIANKFHVSADTINKLIRNYVGNI